MVGPPKSLQSKVIKVTKTNRPYVLGSDDKCRLLLFFDYIEIENTRQNTIFLQFKAAER